MNVKPIDKTKKSNIKCEHCKYWVDTKTFCRNPNSNNFNMRKNYWNRCMQFDWVEKENGK